MLVCTSGTKSWISNHTNVLQRCFISIAVEVRLCIRISTPYKPMDVITKPCPNFGKTTTWPHWESNVKLVASPIICWRGGEHLVLLYITRFYKGTLHYKKLDGCNVWWWWKDVGCGLSHAYKQPQLSGMTKGFITLTSRWVPWRLKSPASGLFAQPFVRAYIKENIKAPLTTGLCEEN